MSHHSEMELWGKMSNFKPRLRRTACRGVRDQQKIGLSLINTDDFLSVSVKKKKSKWNNNQNDWCVGPGVETLRMIFLSLSAVVGCGARRGLADFLPEGKRSQKDPRVVGLLHLRHSGQHWFSLRLAESGYINLAPDLISAVHLNWVQIGGAAVRSNEAQNLH